LRINLRFNEACYSAEDDRRGYELLLKEPREFEPGQTLEVRGLPIERENMPALSRVEILELQPSGLVENIHELGSLTALNRAEWNHRLIRLHGTLRNIMALPAETILILQIQDGLVEVRVPHRVPVVWQEGAVIAVSGVKISHTTMTTGLSRSVVLLRDGRDVHVLQEAPFWTDRRILQALMIFSFLALVLYAYQQRKTSRARRQYEKLFHESGDGLVLLAPDSSVRLVNPAFARLTGLSENIWPGRLLHEVMPAGSQRVWWQALRQTGPGHVPKTFEIELQQTGGSSVLVEGVVRELGERNEGLECVFRDLTTRRLQDYNQILFEATRLGEADPADFTGLCQHLMEETHRVLHLDTAAVWLTDPTDTGIEILTGWPVPFVEKLRGALLRKQDAPGYFISLERERLMAVEHTETDPRTIELWELYYKLVGDTAALEAALMQGDRFAGVICLESAHGARYWTTEEQRFARSLAEMIETALERQARTRAQRALAEANARLEERVAERTRELAAANERLKELDRLKSEFLATMSHELRTPLNSILGFTGLLKAGLSGPVSDDQKEQLDIVYSSSQHLLELINGLLDLSRIEAGRMSLHLETVSPLEVAIEVERLLHPEVRRIGLLYETEVRPATLKVRTDRRKLFQILLNVAANAVKFTPRGHVRVTARTDSQRLIFQVEDTGLGISPEAMEVLFEAFRRGGGSRQRDVEGTGLGLYLCKKLLGLLGGDIEVESRHGEGATFTFWVPLQTVIENPLSP
jgi:PAS domain S-box-containing protein